MPPVVSQRWLTAWLAVVLLGGFESRAAGQAKLPLPDPGAEHPALFLRLMTRLCGELAKAVAVGAPTRFIPNDELFKEGQIQLVERSEVKVSQDHDGRWVLTGPLAVGAHLSETELQAESKPCSTGDNSNSVNVRALHESVRWASCDLRASPSERCQLQVEEVVPAPGRARSLEHMLPRRSFTLTLAPSPRKPQRPASIPTKKGNSS